MTPVAGGGRSRGVRPKRPYGRRQEPLKRLRAADWAAS
jgi:hypothetical protein